MSSVSAVDGTEVESRGSSDVEMVVQGIRLRLYAIVIDYIVDKIDMVMGLDAFVRLGGVTLNEAGVTFSDVGCYA